MAGYVDYSSEGESYWDEDMEDQAITPDSILLSLVQSYDWPGALERIASFADECKAVGIEGRTPLHVACDHDAPAEVVAALLRCYPEASLMVGTSNMNPLHITCSSQHASREVVQVLLDGGHDLQTSMRDVDGDTPLHAACRCGAPMDVLEVLLRANPSLVNERDYEGLTPLLRLWVRYFVILGDEVVSGVQGPSDLKGELQAAWRKTELLLKCAHLGSLEHDDEKHVFRVVHAASAVDCPRPVVRIATVVHPEQMAMRDEEGLTPLLIASRAPLYRVRDLSDEGYMLEDRIHGDEANNEEEGEAEIEPSQPSVLQILVEASPETASLADSKGRLPLHIALGNEKRWSEGVRSIYKAYPDAISIPDGETGLWPFVQAASSSRAETGTILELLKRDPALLRAATEARVSPLLINENDTLQKSPTKASIDGISTGSCAKRASVVDASAQNVMRPEKKACLG